MSEIPYIADRHDGVFPEMHTFSVDVPRFGEELAASLSQWREAGFRFVWLNFSLENAALVAQAAAQGFDYHHIRRSESI